MRPVREVDSPNRVPAADGEDGALRGDSLLASIFFLVGLTLVQGCWTARVACRLDVPEPEPSVYDIVDTNNPLLLGATVVIEDTPGFGVALVIHQVVDGVAYEVRYTWPPYT